MQLEVGDWVYYPYDDMPAIYKLKSHSLDRNGQKCFTCDVVYTRGGYTQEEWLSRLEDFGPGLVAKTKEEKRLLELLAEL